MPLTKGIRQKARMYSPLGRLWQPPTRARLNGPACIQNQIRKKISIIFSDQVLRKRPARQLFNSSAFTGLQRNASIESSSEDAASLFSCAVNKTIGTRLSLSLLRRKRASCWPLKYGMMASVITASIGEAIASFIASKPSAAAITLYPQRCSVTSRKRRAERSSSTRSTQGRLAALAIPALVGVASSLSMWIGYALK